MTRPVAATAAAGSVVGGLVRAVAAPTRGRQGGTRTREYVRRPPHTAAHGERVPVRDVLNVSPADTALGWHHDSPAGNHIADQRTRERRVARPVHQTRHHHDDRETTG